MTRIVFVAEVAVPVEVAGLAVVLVTLVVVVIVMEVMVVTVRLYPIHVMIIIPERNIKHTHQET